MNRVMKRSEIVTLTPQGAADMLERNNYARQRRLRKAAKDSYVREMLRGEFAECTTIELCGYCDGPDEKWVLTDGQHRLTAQVESGVTVEYVRVWLWMETEEAVDRRYAKLDHGQPRTIADDVRAFDLTGKTGICAADAKFVVQGVAFLQNGFLRPERFDFSPADKIELATRYTDAAVRYLDLLDGVPYALRSTSKRVPTMALALATFDEATRRYGDAMVEDFWRGAIYSNALSLDDPRRLANEHLRIPFGKGKGVKGENQYYLGAESARYLADCWNHWTVGNRRTRINRIKREEVFGPIVINGTRWTGAVLRP